MRRIFDNWPKIAFICIPVCLATVNAAVLLSEHLQSDAEKAIRLVRESSSRKENFTVQQYLYSTIYYLKGQGEAIEIEGWRAADADADGPVIVEFRYSDANGQHVASWEARIKEGKVTPINEAARDLSWH
ncbi:MAG: hypothetical protein WBV94_18755 [Blastocatellia bacterium]